MVCDTNTIKYMYTGPGKVTKETIVLIIPATFERQCCIISYVCSFFEYQFVAPQASFKNYKDQERQREQTQFDQKKVAARQKVIRLFTLCVHIKSIQTFFLIDQIVKRVIHDHLDVANLPVSRCMPEVFQDKVERLRCDLRRPH